MKARWLDRDLVAGNYLMLATTEDIFGQAMRRLGIKKPNDWLGKGYACHHEFTSARGVPASVVCIRPSWERSGIATAAMLVHEAVHVMRSSFRGIGEDKPGEEIEAYSMQSIVGYLLEEYVRQTA